MTTEEIVKKIKIAASVFDLPSGVVLGVHSLVMISLSVAAFALKRNIDPTITTVYGIVLGAFAVHKTTTAVTTINQSSSQGPDDKPVQ